MARLTRNLAALLLLALVCAPANADPITLVATVIVQGAGLTGLAALAVYAGAAVLSSADARRRQRAQAAAARASYNASLQDRSVTVLNTEATRKIVYGSPAPVGGALVAMFTSGNRDEYKHLVLVFAAHECQAIDEIYIEGEPLGPLDGNGWVQPGSHFYETLPDQTITENLVIDGAGNVTTSRPIVSVVTIGVGYAVIGSNVIAVENGVADVGLSLAVTYTYAQQSARVNCQKHLSTGGVDTVDAFLASRVPDKWTAAHKLTGYTYAVITLDLDFGRFQGGPPNITAKLRGKNDVYDFRTGTRGYTNNVALCLADYLMSPAGMGATAAQVDAAAAVAAANACDAQGFGCDGVIDCGNGRDANLASLEDAMAGKTHFSGGVWRIMAGAWTTPVMALTDSSTLAGPIEVLQASHPREGRFNGARGQYVPASGLGVAVDITPYNVASYQAADGLALVKDVVFGFAGTQSQCQKLAAIEVERSRLGLTIRYPAHLLAWKLQPGDRVTVDNAELGFVGKTFRMVDWGFDANAPLSLVLTEDAAGVYTGTFNAPDYTGGTSNLPDPFARPPAPAGFTLASGTNVLQRAADGTIITRVLATWSPTVQRAVLQGGYAQLQWRLATAVDDQWQSQDLPADAASAYLVGPQDGTTVIVRVRHVSGLGVPGLWATLAHVVVGKTEPPPDVPFLLVAGTLATWGGVAISDLAGYRLRAWSQSGTPNWAQAAALHDGVLTATALDLTGRLDGVSALLVKAVDTTGNESAAARVASVPALSSLAGNTFASWPQAPDFTGTRTNGAVSGGVLQADDSGDLYWSATDAALFWPANNAALFWPTQTYKQLRYEVALTMPRAGTLALLSAVQGGAVVEYRRDDAALFWGADANVFWGAAAGLFWPAFESTWQAWPGALRVQVAEPVGLRITLDAGAVRGQVSTFTPYLDVPTLTHEFQQLAVAPGGTRVALPSGWTVVRGVIGTVVTTSGAAALTLTQEDFDVVPGPRVAARDVAGTSVAGVANGRVIGY